ncbi:sigma-70 family RNA polymerase sigma factor [Streptosporangium sp. NPDC004379]|uniref:sigma-70 family RNA polymerase sigma factor n=1 Tax=Streptosporangium sp. NPDC004379 TaxID=3366189 RepID=UPI0036D12E74
MEELRRAGAAAPATLYDSYADRLHDYAHSLLGDRDGAAGDAADAVHDALVTARERVDLLRDPGRLRPWLYALTRVESAGRSRNPREPARTAVLEVMDPEDLPDDPGERELALLVHETLAELDGQEREVLLLSARHGLDAAEAGAVLGLGSRQVAARLARARNHLENTAAAVVLAKVGRAHCPDLSAMVDSLEGPLPAMLRRRLSSHIARCEVCMERRGRHVPAERLLDLVPAAFAPLSLRRRVIATCVDPELRDARAAVAGPVGRFDRSGFPVVAGGRGGRRRTAGARRARTDRGREAAGRTGGDTGRTGGSAGPAGGGAGRAGGGAGRAGGSARRAPRGAKPAVVAAACVLAATGVMVAVTGGGFAGGPARGAAPAGEPAVISLGPGPEADPSEPVPGDPADAGETAPEDPEPTGDEEDGSESRTSAPAVPTPSRAAGPARPAPPRPAPRRSPSRRATATPTTPAAGRPAVSCPANLGRGAGQVSLTASGGALSWSASASGGLDVSPASGRLTAGRKAVIWVTAADPSESGSGRVSIRAAGRVLGCALSWEAPGQEEEDPPGDPLPVPSSDPSSATSAEVPSAPEAT